MKKTSRIAVGAACAAIALSAVLVTGPANAVAPANNLTSNGAGSPTSGPDYRTQLEALVGTQTPKQVASIEASGGHVELLVDSGTGAVIAALKPTSVATPLSLTFVGPGCTLTSLCMNSTSNIPYGYTGTGHLAGSWSPIKHVTPGNIESSFDWNGLRNTYAAYASVNLTSPVTVTRIARGE